MRVLLINHEYTLSGASLMMLRLAVHLRDSGHRCNVMAMLSHDGPLRQEYESRGIGHLVTTNFTEYDAVLCNTIFAAPLVAPASQYTKAIWWIHEGENGIDYILGHAADASSAFRDAAAIVFQTEFQRDTIYRSFVFTQNPTKLFIVPLGIGVEPQGPDVAKTRPFRIVSVGTIDQRKRHSDLIRAVHALRRDDVECVIIGKYFHLDEAARTIAASAPDGFRILGEISNVETLGWLRSADVFCLPSGVESQPISIFEAALLARPLVLTDLPAYKGIWRHRQNCLLAPVGDIDWLAHSLALMLSSADLREQLGRAARATARQFSEAAFFARFDAVFSTVM